MSETAAFLPLDPVASQRWLRRQPAVSPWLHEEIARRMLERLDIIRLSTQRCLHWLPANGGWQAHARLQQRCADVQVWQALEQTTPAPGSIDMVWANMALHMDADPRATLEQWRQCLAPGGFLLFSVLGPDSLPELRELYQRHGWEPLGHALTDMHDWGDSLLRMGFADVVMDAERLMLTFATPQRLLQELRELGRNLSPERGKPTRGRQWLRQWYEAVQTLARPDGQLPLTFEIIYGHAIQGQQGRNEAGDVTVDLAQMRRMLLGRS